MNGWQKLRLSEFCRTGTGGTPSRSNLERYYDEGTIPWVKSGELRERLINQTEEHVTEAALKETSLKLIPAGAILLAMYGATVGRLGVLGVEATSNQAVCHIIPDPDLADSRFLFRSLSNQVPNLIAKGVGGAQPNISQGIIKDLVLHLPPLPEQKRIADILDHADALRAKRRAALAELDTLPQSLFLEMFGDPVTNPKGWLLAPLVEKTVKIGSGSTPTGGETAYRTDGISLIRSLNVRDGEFTLKDLAHISDEQAKKLAGVIVEEDDVLLNITGASVARVCRAPLYVLPARVNQHVCIIRPNETLNAVFLEQVLLADQTKRKLLKIGGAGATREAITKAQIETFEVICPKIKLQNEFARRVIAVEMQKSAQRKSLSDLDTLFASLQHRAFRGEL